MQKLIDKLALFGLCLLALSLTDLRWIYLVAMLAALTVGSLCSYFEKGIPIALCSAYTLVCLIVPEFNIFLPLMVYDFANMEKPALRFIWCAALPVSYIAGGWRITAIVALASCVAFLLHSRTSAQLKTQNEFYLLTDDAKERAEILEHKNRELMEKQDYEVRLATLTERNRIAREIHDNVGHLLTRSILQLGALNVTHAADSELTRDLELVRTTMTEAMDSVRSSVHDLHDESVGLKLQLERMIEGFKFCPVRLRYDAGDLTAGLRACFSAVSMEALNNIARHSDATRATITVTEHPAFCQLVIWDNGTARTKQETATGIGLQNMSDRVAALSGVFRAEYDNGFKIFISIPTQGSGIGDQGSGDRN